MEHLGSDVVILGLGGRVDETVRGLVTRGKEAHANDVLDTSLNELSLEGSGGKVFPVRARNKGSNNTSDVRGSHTSKVNYHKAECTARLPGSRDRVGGYLATNPSGKNLVTFVKYKK